MINPDNQPNNETTEEPTMDDFLSAFGVEANTAPEEGQPENEVVPEPETVTPAEEEAPPVLEEGGDKTAQAFAQMRVENKKYQKMITGIAEMLGVQDVTNPEAVTQVIEQKLIEAEAKKQNVPPEMLARLQQLELHNQEYIQNQTRQVAYAGFQKVKDSFKLTNQEVEQFATALQQQGLNPFDKPLDLVKEYRVLNFDKLLADAEAKGAQAEIQRSTKAQNQGSTPNTKQGQGDVDEVKITTVKDLDAWFDKQSK